MEELKQEHEKLTAEVRRLKKITAAMQLSAKLRQHVRDDLVRYYPEKDMLLIKAAECIDSLVREIERCQK